MSVPKAAETAAQRLHRQRQGLVSQENQSGWLMTFVDLVSLVLVFFVLLFSMSAPDPSKWQQVTGTMVEVSGEKRMRGAPPPDPSLIEGEETLRGLDLGYLARLMDQKLSATPELRGAGLREDDDRLVLSLPNDLLFTGGDATLSAKGRTAIFALSVALDAVDNSLLVRGHTDPRPLAADGRFTSNWELSLARALSVAKALRAAGLRKSVSVLGVADTHYAADLPTADAATRAAFARRVDIVFGARMD